MVVTSKLLYNLKAKPFREFFIENFTILQVFEFSSVRRLIFSGAIPPVCVIKYACSNNLNLKNKVKYLSIKPNLFFKLFKTILIEKNDEKLIPQILFKKYDWLWKVLLYGNILDFYFIKELKENFSNIKNLTNIKFSQGLIEKGQIYDVSYLVGKPFLNTQKNNLKKFKIDKVTDIFQKAKVYRASNEDAFKAPYVLLKRGIDSNFSCVAAYSEKDMVFTNSVNSIKLDNDKEQLLNLTGLLNSNLYTYLNLLTASAVGVERNEIYEHEFLKYPYKYNYDIINLVKKLQKSYNSCEFESLNNIIYNTFELDCLQKDLIDYALNISIPIWKYGDNPTLKNVPIALQNATKEQFMDYANVFIETFSEEYQDFYVDIHWFKYCTLFNFKARQSKSTRPQIEFIEDSNIENIVKQISNYSLNDITNEIFIKKDIKGFNENSFFVIKTNEYKNWHKAIARLDVNEFSNAIWEAELEL